MEYNFNRQFFIKKNGPFHFPGSAIVLSCLIVLLFNGCEKDLQERQFETPYVWIVGEQTVMKSINEGVDWYDCVANEEIKIYARVADQDQIYRSIYFNSSLVGCLSGDNGLYAETRDAKSWQAIGIGHDDYTLYSSVMPDTSNIYLCGDNTEIYRIHNKNIIGRGGGLAFVTGSIDVHPNLYGIDFTNSTNGWIVGDNSIVGYTTNSGFSWTAQKTAPNNIYNAVHINRNDSTLREVWIAGEKGIVYTTSDDGATWNNVEQSVTKESLTSICFTGKRTGYFTGKNGVILKTTDNGFHFTLLNSGTTENLNSISFMNAKTGIAVGDHGTVLKTTDAGNTWNKISWNTTKNLYGVCFVKRFIKK